FDQGSMVREYVKWDYELRMGSQLETVVDRALAIASSEPAGPVYLTLPREVLAERMTDFEYSDTPRLSANGATVADRASLQRPAEMLAAAKTPLIIVKSAGRDPGAVTPLVALAEALAIPVVEQYHTHVNFPQDHPLHVGYESTPYVEAADVIVVVETDAPSFPRLTPPSPDPRITHA